MSRPMCQQGKAGVTDQVSPNHIGKEHMNPEHLLADARKQHRGGAGRGHERHQKKAQTVNCGRHRAVIVHVGEGQVAG